MKYVGNELLASFVESDKYLGRVPMHTEGQEPCYRLETWEEAVDRVMDMHEDRIAHLNGQGTKKLLRNAEFLQDLDAIRLAIKRKEILPSMRSMHFGGDAILKKNARMYNCAGTFADHIEVFREYVWMLLCGAGMGISVQDHHVAKLPTFGVPVPHAPGFTFVIEDSIEGWANAFHALITSYLEAPHGDPNEFVAFDYSQIRPKGSWISAGGEAPGHEPLESALEAVRTYLDDILGDQRRQLTPLEVTDILLMSADCVMAGGTRRSATLIMFTNDNEDMLDAKNECWWTTAPWRANANFSATCVRGETTEAQVQAILKRTKSWGEPGVIWVPHTEMVYNPCVEAGLDPVLKSPGMPDRTGIQMCNLVTINMSTVSTRGEFNRRARLATILNTIQATYTNFDFLGHVTERIVERDRLIGVSLTGLTDCPLRMRLDALGGVKWDHTLRRVAWRVQEWNLEAAAHLGISRSPRCCLIKPEGTGSLVLKTINTFHPYHAKRWFKVVRGSPGNEVYDHFAEKFPFMIEKAPDGKEYILFPCEAPDNAPLRDDTYGMDTLKEILRYSKNWVEGGRAKYRGPISHSVSNTVTVKEGEWDAIGSNIFAYQDHLAGVALLPFSGDRAYKYAPMIAVTDRVDQVMRPDREPYFQKELRSTLREHGITDANDEICMTMHEAQEIGGETYDLWIDMHWIMVRHELYIRSVLRGPENLLEWSTDFCSEKGGVSRTAEPACAAGHCTL